MKTSKSAVFLFELMIVILVFTLASAICARIFVSSFTMSAESRDLTMSSINAQTVAEQFKAGASDVDPLCFDRGWAATDESNAFYKVVLAPSQITAQPGMREAYVHVYKSGETESIYTLYVKEFVG